MRKLAVLMPTYNCAAYLRESIDSILNQTYSDFDFYIYDDYSTDNSAEVIKSYTDNRIFYIKNDSNLGISKTLNLGLDNLIPDYQYIARMDADDWAYPERFQKQIDFLEENHSVMLCGTQGFWLKNIAETPLNGWQYPVQNNYISLYLLFAASFGHSSVVFRSNFFETNNLRYNEEIKTCEDWDLWIQVSKIGRMHNLPDFLMKYRIVSSSNHRSIENIQLHLEERSIIISNYWKSFNIKISPEEVYEYYYESGNSLNINFKEKLKTLINNFNILYLNNFDTLSKEEKIKFSYLLARKINSFWKRSNFGKVNLTIWMIILSRVKFLSFIRLIKSQIN